jgi:hypothetical protein
MRGVGLDNFAGDIATTGPTGDLGDELEGALHRRNQGMCRPTSEFRIPTKVTLEGEGLWRSFGSRKNVDFLGFEQRQVSRS